PAVELKEAVALLVGIQHFQGAAAGIDLVVVGEIREPFEDAEQILVPGAAPNLHVAGTVLRAERPEPRQLIATLRRGLHSESAQRAYQMKRLALTRLPRI